MYYNGKEHKLWVDFDAEMDLPSLGEKIIIPVLNEPYNILVYKNGAAELINMDYDSEEVIEKAPCVLTPCEHENIMRFYYPI